LKPFFQWGEGGHEFGHRFSIVVVMPLNAMNRTSGTDGSPISVSEDWTVPLLLSSLAGLSTCIGAAVAFCLEERPHGDRRRKPTVGHSHMAFALTLAGSVMITVSVASILPESFLLDDDIHYLPIGSADFWQRCLAFAFGCGLYVFLSKSIFPEEILQLSLNEEDQMENGKSMLLGSLHRKRGSEDDLLLLLIDEDELDVASIPLLKSAISNGSSKSSTFQRKKTLGSSFDEQVDELNDPKPNERCSNHSRVKEVGEPSAVSFLTKYTRGMDLDDEARRKWRVTMLLFISLAVHNFPEGLAVAASAMHSSRLGVTTTIAIALHNIPEGIAIAIPCLAARPGSPWLAFGLASLSGLTEPLGAAVALAFIDRENNDHHLDQGSLAGFLAHAIWNMKNVLSFVAGIMIAVAVVELFPEAGRHMKASSMPGILGALTGTIVMLASDAYLDA
jgi:zinc transporter, ZIP family